MDKELYWLWISSLDIFNRKNLERLMNYFSEPEEIWKASSESLHLIEGISQKYIEKILISRNQAYIEKMLSILDKNNIKFISCDNPKYPQRLKNIYDFPYVLYLKGKDFDLNKNSIAVVGARKCSQYGINSAKTLSKNLAEENIVIISGMAKGIDSAAHEGALSSSKENATIAVLGCGLNCCYPAENRELMEKIISNGMIISEYPPNIKPNPAFFPKRNRIISGLSKGVIIVEAEKKSGSLITADLALEQGRDVFSVPGNITSKLSEGTNNLIKQGAILVTSYEDVLKEFDWNCTKSTKNKVQENKKDFSFTSDEKMVYDCINDKPQSSDIILNKLEISVNTLQYLLAVLELKGAIQKVPQGYVKDDNI